VVNLGLLGWRLLLEATKVRLVAHRDLLLGAGLALEEPSWLVLEAVVSGVLWQLELSRLESRRCLLLLHIDG